MTGRTGLPFTPCWAGGIPDLSAHATSSLCSDTIWNSTMRKETLNCHPAGVGKFDNHGFIVTKSQGRPVVLVWILSREAQSQRSHQSQGYGNRTEWLHLFNMCDVAPELAEATGLVQRPVAVPPVNPWGN